MASSRKSRNFVIGREIVVTHAVRLPSGTESASSVPRAVRTRAERTSDAWCCASSVEPEPIGEGDGVFNRTPILFGWREGLEARGLLGRRIELPVALNSWRCPPVRRVRRSSR